MTWLFLGAGGVMLAVLLFGQPEPDPEQPGNQSPASAAAGAQTGNGSAATSTDAVARQLHARPVPRLSGADPTMGDVDPDPKANPYVFEIKVTPWGAGVSHITLARYGDDLAPPGTLETEYTVQSKLPDNPMRPDLGPYHYPFAAVTLYVDDQPLNLLHHEGEPVWRLEDPSDDQLRFVATIVDADDEPVLRLTRTYKIAHDSFKVSLSQQIENLSDAPLGVKLRQNAQGDLPDKRSYMGDRRRVLFGDIAADSTGYTISPVFKERRNVIKPGSREGPWGLAASDTPAAWFAMSNRYFTTAVYTPLRDTPDASGHRLRPLNDAWSVVSPVKWLGSKERPKSNQLLLRLDSRKFELAPRGQEGESLSLDLALYAGPKEPKILQNAELHPDYEALGLGELVVYNLGSMCSWFTFAWLAEGLVWFLRGIHYVSHDWGVAIIVLVIIVRVILHPVTKRSQLQMMRVGKQMAAIQPEIQALKEKHGDDREKFAKEQMALMREKGVNPAAMGLGCVPMFLQMPIWIALYAMLFYAIELRHEAAFWGVFQMIHEGWPFLADLAAQDNFIPIGKGFKVPIVGYNINSINLLPILMAVVFYIQQKFMTPTQTAQTDQAKQQQMIMRITVFLFPIFLYPAPSGLTLYIMASTAAGILDSYIVRRHLKREEEEGKLFKKADPNKAPGFLARMQAKAVERRKAMEVRAGSSSKQQQSRKRKKR